MPEPKMRVVVTIGVTFDAESYGDAGVLLDQVDRAVGVALSGRGAHDVTGFQTRPCKTAKFDQLAYASLSYDDGSEQPALAQTPVAEIG